MSLTVNNEGKSTIPPMPEGTYIGVCNMLIDLGVQFNKKFEKYSRKVLIGWEFPDEKIVIDGEEKPRQMYKQYTASLNDRSTLRRDLIAWRGRDFTPEELKNFDLRNIVGVGCMMNIVHTKTPERTYANIGGIIALPKGMPKPKPTGYEIIFDLDRDDLSKIESLPPWIGEIIKASETYLDRISQQIGSDEAVEAAPPEITELDDSEEELPF